MKQNKSVRIISNAEQKDRALNQIKDLLKHIDSFIGDGKRPRKTNLLVSVMFYMPNMRDRNLSRVEKEALVALKGLYDMEKRLWEAQERHSINRNQAIDLGHFLRGEKKELSVKIRQFYPHRKDVAWNDIRKGGSETCDDYYAKIKDTYMKIYSMLKDAPVDEKRK